MTLQPLSANGETNECEREGHVVRVHADARTARDTATVAEESIEKFESDATELDHAGNASDRNADSSDSVGEQTEHDRPVGTSGTAKATRRTNFSRLLAYGLLPGLAVLLAIAAGFLKWQDSSIRDSQRASTESVAAAKDGAIAILSYQPETVEKDLGAARDRLTGTFKDSYTQLTNDVVIPGAKQQHISAAATVPAVASVSATESHAVAILFVNQTVVVGKDAPGASASTVRVTLDKIGKDWLISGFDPV